MKPFGPFYPPLLQLAVSHAERLAQLVASHEAAPPRADEWARAWLTGRAGEVERFVAEATGAWRRGELAESDAAQRVDRYLATLHDGLRRLLNLTAPACCTGAAETTAVSAGYPCPSLQADTVTREVLEPTGHDGGTAVDAVLSIDDLLDGMLTTGALEPRRGFGK
jgi:hypothetical protein